jgi:hypothetical protein
MPVISQNTEIDLISALTEDEESARKGGLATINQE